MNGSPSALYYLPRTLFATLFHAPFRDIHRKGRPIKADIYFARPTTRANPTFGSG
jgi:hypothetical protein